MNSSKVLKKLYYTGNWEEPKFNRNRFKVLEGHNKFIIYPIRILHAF